MTAPLVRLLTVAVCAATLTGPIALAGPAAADSEVVKDPRGDTSQALGRGQVPAPEQADILRLKSRHADGVVFMRVTLADLDPAFETGANFGVATPDGTQFVVRVNRGSDGGTSVRLVDPASDTTVKCPRLGGAVTPDTRQIMVSIPRSCVGRPRFVRTGAEAISLDAGTLVSSLDDARRDGQVRRTGRPYLGSRRLLLN